MAPQFPVPVSCCVGRAMAAAESPRGDSLDLPSASAIGDYVLLRRPGPSVGVGGDSLSSADFHSVPCSSDVEPDPGTPVGFLVTTDETQPEEHKSGEEEQTGSAFTNADFSLKVSARYRVALNESHYHQQAFWSSCHVIPSHTLVLFPGNPFHEGKHIEIKREAQPNLDSSNLNTELKDSQSCENFWLDPSAKGQLEAKDEDAGLRESLDRFYDVFGRPQPASEDPLLASVCHCLSQKIAELQGQGSQKYALRSFQMARVIFSREGCSVLRKHCRDTRFYPLCEGSLALDDEKQTPGLSKDVIHFLLQQNVMEDP
ncbi:hypothetical protein H920_16423 [Fukomys damarensis]|uniref:Shieldin complex subunit 1 C-terminal domain-containing protein n=1 Tax=Fukomys damarensis TaxID=885580 RepID=A0A091CS97_FUKDA|nr:hypothetical protein H920_16423 [Fukomys damarensis]